MTSISVKMPDGRELELDIDPAYRAAVLALVCPYCGKGPFRMLAGHTHQKHGVGSVELKDKAGLVIHSSLVSEELHNLRAENTPWKTLGRPKGRARHAHKVTRAGQAEQRRKLELIAEAKRAAKYDSNGDLL